MHLTKLKHLLLLAGLLAAGPAWAGTLTVYPSMIGPQAAASAADLKYGAYYAVGQVVGGAIDCPTNYTAGMAGKVCVVDATGTVALVAGPVSNAVAVAWAGCPAGAISTTTVANDTCTLAMGSEPQTVEATFKPLLYPLELTTLGPPGYTGVVTTAAGACRTGAAAPNDVCSQSGTNGTTIPVVASPGAGNKVTWTGCTVDAADPTGNTCQVALTSPKGVSATFGTAGIPVTVQLANYGASGTIAATVGGLPVAVTCAAGICQTQVAQGDAITLTGTPVGDAKFIGFTGCGATAAEITTTCALTNVQAAKNVAATFKPGGNCHACHDVPPANHGGPTASCSGCHPGGYSGNTVSASTHMDGSATLGDCTACHDNMSNHGQGNVTTSCRDCHDYTKHQDGTANQIVPLPPTTIAAGDGFDCTVLSATLPGVGLKPTVRVQCRDNAGNGLSNLATTYWTGNQYRKGWLSTGSSTAPRIALVKLNADFTVNQMLAKVATPTVATSSETTTQAVWVAVDAAQGIYDINLALTVLMPTYDPAATYRVALIGGRWGGSDRNTVTAANPTLDFRPDAGSPLVSHDIVTDAACGACHGKFKLGFHTDVRVSPRVCKMCHYDGLSGTTKALDMGFQNMVHRLHSGLVVKTNPWSGIKMAPSHSLYFEGGSAWGSGTAAVAVIDPELTTDCKVCHQGVDASAWYKNPSIKACGSCHDAVDFTTGVGHDGGIVATDAECKTCHKETGNINAAGAQWPIQKVHGRNFEPAHKVDFTVATPPIPADGHQFAVSLVDVTADTTGAPTFTVDVTLDGAYFDIKTVVAATSGAYRIGTCAFQLAGPTTDYQVPGVQYASPAPVGVMGSTPVSCTTAANWTKVADANFPNRWTYRDATKKFFASANVPAGYYTAAFEIMMQRVVQASNGDYVRKPSSANPNFLLVKKAADFSATTVTDQAESALNARRSVVEFDKCNNCHVDLGFHSNRNRKGPDYCATCHNPKLDNAQRARARQSEIKSYPGFTGSFFLPESVSMNVFIHRIHMGKDLPSVVTPANASPWNPLPGKIEYGALRGVNAWYNPDPAVGEFANFNGFGMPNPMERCDQCHVSNGAQKTWALNESAGLKPIERTLKTCASTVTDGAGTVWCAVADLPVVSTSAKWLPPAANGTVYTPPLKAVCTSCHDTAATDAHADFFTINPMKADAVETCASCHGAGKAFDSIVVHQPLP